jgi:NAD(P)H-hydrate epimerase
MRALTREQVRRIDQLAIEKYGIPGIVLMENAARAAADEALAMLRSSRTREPGTLNTFEVAVVCGGGNNGGDGFAAARHLHNAGVRARVFAVSDPSKLRGDALTNWRIVEHMRIERDIVLDAQSLEAAAAQFEKAGLIIDAILGTGFSGALKPHTAEVIRRLNRAASNKNIPILAVDLPSGLDCDTGIPSNPTIRANATVTFVAPKIGFDQPSAAGCLGRVIVAGIGAPPEIVDEVLRA